MTNSNETFSAFIDSELTNSETNEQINEASSDVNLRYRMQRYQLIGDVMRKEAGESIQLDFAAQIREKIDQLDPLDKPEVIKTETVESESSSWFAKWFKPMTGVAVAASVAWVAVVSLQGLMDVDSRTGEFTQQANEIALSAPNAPIDNQAVSDQVNRLAQLPVLTNAVSVSAPATLNLNTGRMNWSTAKTQGVPQSKLNAYLVTHTEYSNSMQGMMPQARVAGFDVNP